MRPQRHADKAPAKPWPKGKALFPEQKPLFVEGDDEMGRLRLAHHLRYTARGLYQEENYRTAGTEASGARAATDAEPAFTG